MDYEKLLKEEWVLHRQLIFSEDSFEIDDNFKLVADTEFKEGFNSDESFLIELHEILPNFQKHHQGKPADIYLYGKPVIQEKQKLTYEDKLKNYDSTLTCPYKVYETTYVNSEELEEFHELFLDTMKFINFMQTDDETIVSALVDEQRLKNKENPVLPMSLWIALHYGDLGGFVEEKIYNVWYYKCIENIRPTKKQGD